MILVEEFRKFRVSITFKKQITLVDPSTWINENTLHQMKLRLTDGAWVQIDGFGPGRFEVG